MTEILDARQVDDVLTTDDPTAPVWFYRFNPFTRRRLAQEPLRELISDVLRLDAAVQSAADHAGEELHVLIGEAEGERRKELLTMSRALRRGKKLPDGSQPESVREWQRLADEREALLDRLTAVHTDAASAERRLLATQLQDPTLAASLALVSPEVARQAARYVESVGPTGSGSARMLKSERGLLQYVLRAAVRTSPLSQLTAVGLTAPAPGGCDPDRPVLTQERSFFSLDRIMLDYVVGGLLPAADDPVIALPPTSALAEDRLLFLAPGADGGYRRVGVPLRPPLSDVVQLLSLGPVALSTLARTVSVRRPGAGADEVAAFVRQAVERGALCTVSPTTDADTVDLDDRGVPALDPTLRTVRDLLARLAEAPAADRAALLAEVDEQLGTLSRRAGRPARVAVTEDRLAEIAPVDPDHWGGALDDLGPAVELLHTFDWLADVALALRESFVRTHGAGARTSLVDQAPRLVAEVTAAATRLTAAYAQDDPAVWDDFGGPDGVVARLYAVRRRVEDEVRRRFDAAVAAGDTEVELSPADVADLLSGLPEVLRSRPLGYGVLVQSTEDGLVVNDGLPGHGMLYSRFLGMDHALGGSAAERLQAGLQARYGEPGVTLVEDRSLHNLNVNVHPQVLPRTLGPSDWARLELVHDESTDQLQVRDGDEHLKVLPIGGGHPGLYPPPLSVASGLVIAGRLYNGLPDAYAAQQPDTDQTRRVPRMRVGQVVVSRARWFPGDDLDAALAEPDECRRLLAVARWRQAHGVPEQVVVKSMPADAGPASVGSPEAQEVRFRSKPQYIDLTSALCVRVLPRMLERRGGPDAPAVYLEEAAPDITAGPHAAEWVVEVARPAGGHFTYGGTS